MDRVTAPSGRGLMPPPAPRAMPVQDFGTAFRDANAPQDAPPPGVALWRAMAFSPAMAATGWLAWVMFGWFADHGISAVEAVLIALISFNFFWIAFTLGTVALGLWSLSRQGGRPRSGPARAQSVALLVPIHNEVPWYVLGNARSMLEELRTRGGGHRFAMFILSDTRDAALARQEETAVRALRADLGGEVDLYYRHRARNTDRKVGNIADWVARWGGAWDAMLVLDADSLMTGRAIVRLTDALARDPAAGLIQSFPQLIGAQTVFARMQQFASGVYGLAFAEGLARWCGAEGNYWGHNAIIRTAAFAACAGLPHLGARKRLILSHDFVEAGLLRRAGWAIRFLPRIRGSFEETPATLIDHIRRDRRWCQGNLQHLRLLGARGFRPISRFHLLHGAIGYLLSPIWFALLVMWALIGRGEEASVLSYFSEANPLMPTWPQMTEARHVLIVVLMYAMLLAPRIIGLAALPLTGARLSDFGGAGRLALSFVSELLLSILYAPILMVQQMLAVARTALGLQSGWAPQARAGGTYPLRHIVICHALETVSGAALLIGMGLGVVSPWLLPIAVSLALAVPLSAISGASPAGLRRWLGSAQDYRAPPIAFAARHYRAELKSMLEGTGHRAPAE